MVSAGFILVAKRGSCKIHFFFLCHSERSEESQGSKMLRSFTSFRMTKTAILQEAQKFFPLFSPCQLKDQGDFCKSSLHILQNIFNVPEDGAAAEILVPAAVGDGFGGMAPLVAVRDFEEFISPAGGLVVGGRGFGCRKRSFEFQVPSFERVRGRIGRARFGAREKPGVGKRVVRGQGAGVRRAVVSGQGPGVS